MQRAILLVAFSPCNPYGLVFTSSTMMRIINPHHSTKQQAGPCHEKLNSVRQQASKGHGQMQQHKVAMTNAMVTFELRWCPAEPVIHPRSSCISAERQELPMKPLHTGLGVKLPLTISQLLQPMIPDSSNGGFKINLPSFHHLH